MRVIYHRAKRDLAAMLGGKLVYEYAVGIQRQGHSLEIKDKMS